MSLGKDLESIRKSKHLTLEDIQNAIKIPTYTISEIENDRIWTESTQSKTYIRSFIRSYARFLGIPEKEIVSALDARESGNYNSNLLAGSGEADDADDSQEDSPVDKAGAKPGDEPKERVDTDSGDEENESETEENTVSGTFKPSAAGQRNPRQSTIIVNPEDAPPEPGSAPDPSKSDKTEGGRSKPVRQVSAAKPSVSSINWADMGKKFNPATHSPKAWLLISLTLLIIVLIALGIFFSSELSSLFSSAPAESSGSEENMTAIIDPDSTQFSIPGNSASGLVNNSENRQTVPSELGDTLTVAVYAAYGILDPVRVTSDFNWRTNPFWMEQGQAFNFDFRDTLLVRGQYEDLELLFNGHVIENPRQNYFSEEYNSLMITRDILNRSPFNSPAPATFPLNVPAPDTIVYRISF